MPKDILEFLSFSNEIRDICTPLFDSTKIKFFDYECFYDSGELVILSSSNNTTLYQQYFDQKLYAKKNELLKVLELKLQATILSEFMPLPSGISATCPIKYMTNIQIAKNHDIYHRLCLYKKEDNCIKVIAFGVIENDPTIFEFFLNSLQILKEFVAYVETLAYPIFLNCIKKNRIILSDYSIPDYSIIETEENFSQLFLKGKFSIFKELTYCELKCLVKFLQGYSAKEIARRLMISPRTVETHVYHAKKKLGILSKQQLRDLLCKEGLFINW